MAQKNEFGIGEPFSPASLGAYAITGIVALGAYLMFDASINPDHSPFLKSDLGPKTLTVSEYYANVGKLYATLGSALYVLYCMGVLDEDREVRRSSARDRN